MRALTPALQEGGEALYRACEAINRKAVCAHSCGNGLCDCGGFRDFRDGVEVASFRLHFARSRAGETPRRQPRAAAERKGIQGQGRQGRSDTNGRARSGRPPIPSGLCASSAHRTARAVSWRGASGSEFKGREGALPARAETASAPRACA